MRRQLASSGWSTQSGSRSSSAEEEEEMETEEDGKMTPSSLKGGGKVQGKSFICPQRIKIFVKVTDNFYKTSKQIKTISGFGFSVHDRLCISGLEAFKTIRRGSSFDRT